MNRCLSLVGAVMLLSTAAPAIAHTVKLEFHVPGQPPVVRAATWSRGITVEQAMRRSNGKFVTLWTPGLGNALLMAEGTPALTNGALGTPFWWLCIDGKSPKVGMTNARIPSWRSRVEWFWTTEAACVAH